MSRKIPATQLPGKIYTPLAIGLALIAVLAAYLVTDRVFENLAHLEDEQAFVWQAAVMAKGKLTLPSPPSSKSFLWPFVIDYNGQRFGKYPLGWPAVLSLGYLLNIRSLVNPLLAGLGVWLTYLLGKRIFGAPTGLLAAGLTLASPFFLMISGSLLSHPLGLVLSATFALCWLAAFTDSPGKPGELMETDTMPASEGNGFVSHDDHRGNISKQWLAVIGAGLALGALAITRPWTAVGVGLPFAIHGLFLLVRSDGRHRRMLLVLAGIALGLASLHLVWQWRATGNPFINTYTLWWSYDKIGFGPGHGVNEAGHTLQKGIRHVIYSFRGGFPDLYGWKLISHGLSVSAIFIPFGILALWKLPAGKRLAALLSGSVILGLVLVHLAYWVGSYILGPRYYYEGLYSLTIFSAAGIIFLAGGGFLENQPGKFHKLRSILMAVLVACLMLYNLLVYLPDRLAPLHGLYGVSRSFLDEFLTAEGQNRDNLGIFRQQDLKAAIPNVKDTDSGETRMVNMPVLVIVHVQDKWIEYGTLLELQIGDFTGEISANPFLDAPYIFAISRGLQADQQLALSFPDRAVIHFYPKESERFYTQPLDEP